ncbi:Homeobox domain [Carpediemonas membranifera]|uniref:Homeobox domain n=1 Tax=Carpediemonas membranifera TaxID=201153 RepID=A0A8J6C032_9EUKA|nr:Homeobox domain [Carpediemonas membranifera]|eukprot:KAG9396156.1 Homeobox domain [Carpediemonas membranifera]
MSGASGGSDYEGSEYDEPSFGSSGILTPIVHDEPEKSQPRSRALSGSAINVAPEGPLTLPPLVGPGAPAAPAEHPQLPAMIARRPGGSGRRGKLYKAWQYDALAAFFNYNAYPDKTAQRGIARFLGLELVQIRGWFQNQRNRSKTSKLSHATRMTDVELCSVYNDTAAPHPAVEAELTESAMPHPPAETIIPLASQDEAVQVSMMPDVVGELYLSGQLDGMVDGLGSVYS